MDLDLGSWFGSQLDRDRSVVCPPPVIKFFRVQVLMYSCSFSASNTAYGYLLLEAQLNVDTDADAGFFQCIHPAQRPLRSRAYHPIACNFILMAKVIYSGIKQKL
jgi:hypothetical protein